MKAAKLIPPDPERCQAEITAAHGPFVLGPRPLPQRCRNAPLVVVTESRRGTDGRRGAMSLCASCLDAFEKQAPPGFATAEPLGCPLYLAAGHRKGNETTWRPERRRRARKRS